MIAFNCYSKLNMLIVRERPKCVYLHFRPGRLHGRVYGDAEVFIKDF